MNSDRPEPESIPPSLTRYSRQIRFQQLGVAGQKKLSQATALVVGCGALGSVIAESLARAGVGCLRIVDRDFLEIHNLQRQVLYDESDVRAGLPKAIAAANKLRMINSTIDVQPFVEDLEYRNIGKLADSADVIVDGTDNFETRFLINDFALQSGTPWIYGGCIGSEGQTMTIVPDQSNCLHCLMAEGPPPPGTTDGCDMAGILGPVVNVVASLQSIEALKILSGNLDAVSKDLTVIDLWSGRLNKLKLGELADKIDCPACRGGQRPWLSGQNSTQTAVLCGRNSVQIRGAHGTQIDLAQLDQKLSAHGSVTRNEYLLKFEIADEADISLTVFENSRTIVAGTGDVAKAKSLFAQWVGG